jgi:hypothetical protein
MPLCTKYCDKISSVIGSSQTVDLRDDGLSGGWAQIDINTLLNEMETAKKHGIAGAMHLKGQGNYTHFCAGQANMTLIGGWVAPQDYALGYPRTYGCLHIVQPAAVWKMAADSPQSYLRLSFEAISKARYSAWWNHRDPQIWRRTNIGNGYFPDKHKGQAIEIAINFCVDVG